MQRDFYLYPNKKGFFIAEFINPETGVRLCFRTTQSKVRDEAMIIADRWLQNGIPKVKRGRQPIFQKHKTQTINAIIDLATILKTLEELPNLDAAGAQQIAEVLRARGLLEFPTVKAGSGRVDFIEYLKKFWDYDKSPYIKDRLAHNHSIGIHYCYGNNIRIERYWKGQFSGRALASITRAELKKISLELAKNKLSSSYINSILKTATIPLAYATSEGIIAENPAKNFEFFSGKGRKRGVLTPQEAAKLFSICWKDERVKIGSMLAMTTGCRLGEVRALRKSDIDTEKPILYIRHNWTNACGSKGFLKAPKNGEERRVPLLPEIRSMLEKLLNDNPYKDNPDPFIFFSTLLKDQLLSSGLFLKGLKESCEIIGVDYVSRNICFHSWRHFWVSRMADSLAIDQVARISGHKSIAVAEHYANHVLDEAVEKTAEAGVELFGKILNKKGDSCMNCILLTKAEVAERLGYSITTIDRLRRSGILPYRKIFNSVRFIEKDIDDFIQNSLVTGWCPQKRKKERDGKNAT
jgi:integrase/predicted DNA-binding transcriptional regulator AlpA